MSGSIYLPENCGLEVIDLRHCPEFEARVPHARDVARQMEGMQSIAHAFVEQPDTLLQELVNAAMALCDADSAGISMEIEEENRSDTNYFRWVATAGAYSRFLNATLPRLPSACSTCLERGQPQLLRVTKQFFDLMGVEAPLVTDGLLLPWQVEGRRGTIWIMAHERTEAFDNADCRVMQVLADFVAMAVRHERQQGTLMKQAKAASAASMANALAHQINNPLQSMTNLIFLAARQECAATRSLAAELSEQIQRLSVLVNGLLALRDDAGLSNTKTAYAPAAHSATL